MAKPIKFTVITSVLNAGELLSRTATSLQNQTYRNFEWIIVDGASTDNTLQVARGFSDFVTVLISETDSGIYHAWNKALPLITGDWTLFLGAGDELYNASTLEHIATILSTMDSDISIAYGNVVDVDHETGQEFAARIEDWKGLEGPWFGARPMLPCQQGVLHKTTLFAAGFRFDTRCKIASDGELLLRELLNGHGTKLPIVVTRFLSGGVSSTTTNRLRMVAEIVYINIKVGIFFRRPIRQIAALATNLVKHIPHVVTKTRR